MRPMPHHKNELRLLITVPNNHRFDRGKLLKDFIEKTAHRLTHLPVRSEIAVTSDDIKDHKHRQSILQNFEPHLTIAFSERIQRCICHEKNIHIPVKSN